MNTTGDDFDNMHFGISPPQGLNSNPESWPIHLYKTAYKTVKERLEKLEKYLHSRCLHPDYQYTSREGQRKAFYDENEPPEGDGWERNIDCGRDGWERFDYTEESYWRRLKPPPELPLPKEIGYVPD